MKIFTAAIMVIQTFCCFVLQAQTGYPPCAAYDNEGKDTIRAINSYCNCLYAGMDNYIEINRKRFPYQKFIVECSMGMVMDDADKFIVMPAKPGYTKITVYQFDKGDTVELFTKKMKVNAIPPPYITFSGSKLGENEYIKRELLLNDMPFEVHLSDDFIDDKDWYTVKEIGVGYLVGQVYVTKVCESNKLTDEIKQALSKLLPGKEISFTFKIASESDIYKRIQPIRVKLY